MILEVTVQNGGAACYECRIAGRASKNAIGFRSEHDATSCAEVASDTSEECTGFRESTCCHCSHVPGVALQTADEQLVERLNIARLCHCEKLSSAGIKRAAALTDGRHFNFCQRLLSVVDIVHQTSIVLR